MTRTFTIGAENFTAEEVGQVIRAFRTGAGSVYLRMIQGLKQEAKDRLLDDLNEHDTAALRGSYRGLDTVEALIAGRLSEWHATVLRDQKQEPTEQEGV